VNEFADLQIPTAGMYPITVSRRYDSSRTGDGPLGVGWSSSLTAHLYYATYLLAAPSTYSYEADIVMPDGVLYRFTTNGNAFTPPSGRYDTLVKNVDGTYALTLQRSRSVYRFNADGSLASLTDDYGNIITYTNDTSGRLQRVADSAGSGRYIDVTWGSDGRIASLTDNGGRILKYFYENGNGTLSSFSDPLVASDSSSRSTYYTYVSGRFGMVLSRIADRWHRVISDLDWYPNGKLKSYTEGAYDGSTTSPGERYVYTYMPAGVAGSVTKTDSFTSASYNYDSSGLVTKPMTTYDAVGNVATDSSGGVQRSYQYSQGKVTSMSEGWQAVTWTYTYDTNFPDKIASITPDNSQARPGWVYQYNGPGTTAAGALAVVYRTRSDGTTRDQVATYTYDSRGHVLSFADDNRLANIFAYNAAGDLISITAGDDTMTYGYDSLGRQISMTTPDGYVTSYTYDALDRITSVTLPKPTASSNLNFVTTYTYDNYDSTSGLVFKSITDANGRVTKSGYDALGHVGQTVDAAGSVTAFTYQSNLLKKITDANGNTTSYNYTAHRILSGKSFPDGTSESYVISDDGVLHSRTDRKGQQFSYAYDNLGRLTSVGFTAAGVFIGRVYAYAGPFYQGTNVGQNLVTVYDYGPSGHTDYGFTYDSSFRLTVQETGNEKTTYTYADDPAGFAGSLISGYTIAPSLGKSGTTQSVSYGYDWARRRITSIAWSWIPGQPFTISYVPSGYSRITYPNGQTRVFSYDHQGRLTNITNNDPQGNFMASFDYGYDHDWIAGTDTMLGPRTSVNVAAIGGTFLETGLTKYSYDLLYQLGRQDHPNGTFETWSYDAIGNRTSWRSNYGFVVPSTYFKNGTNTNNGQRLRNDGFGPSDYTYDANGNVTMNSSGGTFAWDYANRLISNSSGSYSYDYLGRRQSMTTNGTTTRYISEGPHTVGERNTSGGVATDYLFGPGIDEPLAKHTANGAISYYGVDGLGSIVLTTDSSGIMTSSNRYSAWGAPATINGDLFGYTGRENGGPSWFYRSRHYDWTTGRFLSEDSVNYLGTSAYAYVGNMPISYVDPSGAVAVNRSSASSDEDWQKVIAHCGGRFVNGCVLIHGHTNCACSAGCDMATRTLVYKPNVSITTSIDAHIATNSPFEKYSDIKEHELRHVAEFNAIIDGMVSRARDLESQQYSSLFGCKVACGAFLFGNTMRNLATAAGEWFHNEGL
jgi:RHS repeat-associated protein